MDELTLFARVLLGTLFASTAWAKGKDLEKHIIVLREYQLLPPNWLHWFARMEIIAEALAAFLLLVGLLQQAAYTLAIILLSVYSLAIAVNLLRGRREISCGCGGLAGSHHLSWGLVWRNIGLLAVCCWLLFHPLEWGSFDAVLHGQSGQFFHLEVLQVVLISLTSLMMAMVGTLLVRLRKRIESLFRRN